MAMQWAWIARLYPCWPDPPHQHHTALMIRQLGLRQAHLDGIEAIIAHVHAKEDSAACTSPQILDHHVLIDKCASSQFGQFQAACLPAATLAKLSIIGLVLVP